MRTLRIVLLTVTAMSLAAAVAAPAAADDDPPAAAVAALKEIRADVVDLLASDASRSPGNVTIGRLHPSYMPSESLARGSVGISLSQRLESRDEWIAVVYSDGVATDVVGVWEAAPGRLELSTFGYGRRLAEALDGVPGGSRAMYEAPIGTWYLVSATAVTPLNTVGGRTMDWPQFADEYRARTAAMLPDGTGTFGPQSPGAWAGLAAGLVFAAGMVLVASRRRTRHVVR